MATWASGDIVANGFTQHFYRTGGDKPQLVLLHGASDSGMCWIRLAKALEGQFDIIMPDARGHGLSGMPEGTYTSQARADDVAALIRALGLQQPIVGGHSMGAQTTLYFAASYPDLLRAAILEDPVFRTASEAMTPEQAAERQERARKAHEERVAMTKEQIIAMGKTNNPKWDAIEFEPWAEAKLQFRGQMGGGMLSDQRTWQQALALIKCPLLVITADPALGAIVSEPAAHEAQEILPHVTIRRLSGAGHNVRREQFTPFVTTVEQWIGALA